MISIEAATADDAWRQAGRQLQGRTGIQSGRDQPTRELLHVAFSIADPRQRVVFARPFNPALAIAEVIWILAGGDASEFLVFWNPRLKQFLDADPRMFHGAYGFRLGSRPTLQVSTESALRVASNEEAPDQLRLAYEALRRTPDSRQVVLQFWNPTIDSPNPHPRSADVPCNLVSHLMIRDSRLEWLQVMRSNDLMWGTPCNFVQFTCLQEIVAGWLDVDVGSYVHLSDSLHVYERHWPDLDVLQLSVQPSLPVNHADLRIGGYKAWEDTFALVADAAVRLAGPITPHEVRVVMQNATGFPAGYLEWISLLASESLRRSGYDLEATKLIVRAGEYWAESWRRWHESHRRRAAA